MTAFIRLFAAVPFVSQGQTGTSVILPALFFIMF